ncbi:DeoR/GlpR family DNA-binding transcription regulator [Microbacterium sp. LWH7-1.2]|uniref:DeoR/GlpR family DNA-binding transcription regulator n=1 Tax=Microbacterium sp. LWH7-1.2 TaxID=3135257 RepID=UPI0031398964
MANDVISERSRHLPAGRRAALLELLGTTGQLSVGEIAEQFKVSIDTIRRDLDQLDAEGLLVRTHGGAVSVASSPRSDRGMDVRMRMQTAEKEAIAELAAGLVVDGSVLMLNGGTTTLAVARALREHRELTLATNNLRIPAEVPVKALRDLYVFGGSVRTVAQTTTGPVSFQLTPGGEQLAVQADLAIIGVGAVSTSGYSTSNLGDAAMMAEMMAHASKVAILADSSKLGRRLFAQIADLGRADWFITDAPPPPDLAAALASAEVEVLVP